MHECVELKTTDGNDMVVDVFSAIPEETIDIWFHRAGTRTKHLDMENSLKLLDAMKRVLSQTDVAPLPESCSEYVQINRSIMSQFKPNELRLSNDLGKMNVLRYKDGDVLFIVGDKAFDGLELANDKERQDVILDIDQCKKLVEHLTKHINKTESE